MSDFSPTDAAFEGFRLTKEKPVAVLAWSAIFAVTILIASMLIVMGLAPKLAGAASNLDTDNPAAVMGALSKVAPVLLALLGVWVVLSAIISAAIYRCVLDPSDSRHAYLQFGPDEVRQIGALFICLLAAMGFSLVLSIGLVAPLQALHAGKLVMFLGDVVILSLQIWFGLRLAMLPPLTFGAKRIDVKAAWKMTKGQIPRLLSMYILAITFAAIVYFLITVVSTALAVGIAGGDMGVIRQIQNPTAGLAPRVMVAVLVYALISLLTPVLLMVIIQAPAAVAYRALSKSAAPAA
jgi:hypothetical protein